MAKQKNDLRFTVPIYTRSEAARLLGVPSTTFRDWLAGYERRGERATKSAPILTQLKTEGRGPSVPFVGLAEGMVLAAIRKTGVPLQRIRPALDRLAREIGVEHALASQSLYTDGAEVLFDFANASRDDEVTGSLMQLVVVRNNQRVFTEVVEGYLQRIEYDGAGWATRLRLPEFTDVSVVVDPNLNFGQPFFDSAGVPLAVVLSRWDAGESFDELARDFGVDAREIEDAARVSSRPRRAA